MIGLRARGVSVVMRLVGYCSILVYKAMEEKCGFGMVWARAQHGPRPCQTRNIVERETSMPEPSHVDDTRHRLGQVENVIHTGSRPSQLKITDMRLAVVASIYDYPILRIDTNQGVYGLGERRDAGHVENALQFKSLLLRQNPCNVH